MENKKPRAALIYLLFFFSGISGLIYQVIWVRMFGNFFGNTIYSASIVTSVFMLGLGAGGYLAGVWSDRQYNRLKTFGFLRVYGFTELAIAVLGLALAFSLPGLRGFLGAFLRYAADGRGWHHLAFASHLGQVAVAIVVMLPVTLLMGATLSLLIRQLVAENIEAAGWRIGVLYGFNTAGAALGCFSTDLFLVPKAGLLRTQLVAVALNIFVGSTAILLGKKALEPGPGPILGREPLPGEEVVRPSYFSPALMRPVALALFFSGLAAMGMEIVWFRILSASLGEFRAVFSLVLTVILIGIWLGSLAGGYSVKRWGKPLDRFILVQALFIFSTMLLLVSFNGADAEAYLMKRILQLPAAAGLPRLIQVWGVLRPILAVVALPSLLIGFSFPLANAHVQRLERRVGRRAGSLYLANTVGAVLGAIMAGFVLLPNFGSQRSILFLCGASGLAMLCLQLTKVLERSAAHSRARYGSFIVYLLMAAAIAFTWTRLPADHLVRSAFPRLAADQRVLASAEGVNEMLMVIEDAAGGRFLLTNGHSMSGTAMKLQRYMRAFVHIPLLQLDSPGSVLVICFGVGNTLHAASLHPTIRRLEVVDLSEKILEHAAYFRGSNRDILEDKRVSVYLNDGRLHLQMMSPGAYDLITLEPPPISFAGVSSLYSREFYALARSRLKSGGFVTQWLPLYQVSPEIGLSMVRAFLDVFPNAVLLSGMEKELIIMGRNGPRSIFDPDLCVSRIARAPLLGADLDRIHLGTLTEMIGTFVANSADLQRATRHVRPVTDDNRSMEYGMLSKFTDTGLARELFRVEGVAAWCPDCFVNGQPRRDIVFLEKYLAALDVLYRSEAFVFFRSAWGGMGGSDIDFLDRDGSLGTVVSRFPYLNQILASPLTGSLEKVIGRPSDGPWSVQGAREIFYPDAAMNIRMAMKLLRTGRLFAALKWFERAVEIDPGYAAARFGLGYALFYAGNFAAAAEQYRRGLDMAPGNIEARFSLAVVFHRLGRLEDEIDALERILRQEPENMRAADRLGLLRINKHLE